MKLQLFSFLLSVVAPLLVSCTPDSNAGTPLLNSNDVQPLPTVSFSVIASGDNTINGLPVNRKLEIYTNQTAFNTSLYLFMEPIVE
jgi:hypothetical protein